MVLPSISRSFEAPRTAGETAHLGDGGWAGPLDRATGTYDGIQAYVTDSVISSPSSAASGPAVGV